MKRVVFLRSNPVDPDPRVEKEARALCKAGYDITIVGWDRYGNSKQSEQTEFARIERLTIPAGFGNGIKNLPQLLKWQLALLKWLIKHDYDILHSCDFDTVLPAFIISRFKKVKVVYDIFDFYADMLRNTPAVIKKIIKKVDRFMINNVDAVILADEVRKDQIGETKPKILEIIYNTPPDIGNLGATFDNRTFYICYVGILQKDRGLFEAMEVVSRHPEWKMEIAGFGAEEEEIRRVASQHNNITFHGRVNYDKAIEINRSADVLFATYDPAVPNNKYASPNKMFEAMMLGRPIIVSDDTSMADKVCKIQNGIVIRYGDKRALEEAITLLCSNKELRDSFGRNARNAYTQQYGWRQMEKRLISLYSKL